MIEIEINIPEPKREKEIMFSLSQLNEITKTITSMAEDFIMNQLNEHEVGLHIIKGEPTVIISKGKLVFGYKATMANSYNEDIAQEKRQRLLNLQAYIDKKIAFNKKLESRIGKILSKRLRKPTT